MSKPLYSFNLDGENITTKAQQKKAASFIEHGCIHSLKSPLHMIDGEYPDYYICTPIEGYNVTTYTIRENVNGSLHCDCQFNKTTEKMCSHILAVLLFREKRLKL